MEFGIEFEKQLLAVLISNNKFMNAGKFFKQEYFSLPTLQFIYSIYEYYNKNANSSVNDFILKEECKSNKIEEEYQHIIIAQHEELKDLYKNIHGAEKGILYKAKEFAKNKLLKSNIDKIKQLNDDGKYEDAYKLYQKIDKETKSYENDYDHYDVIDWFESYRDRAKIQKNILLSGIKPIRTGFSELDKLMGGGYVEGDMFSISAATNLGKSALMTHFCGYNADQGIGGILFLTEMHAYRMAMRLDARNTHVDFKRFKNYEFTAQEEEKLMNYYERHSQHYKNLLKLVSVKKNSQSGTKVHGLSFDFMRSCVDDLRNEIKNFRYVGIDCGNHIRMSKDYKTEKEKQADFAWHIDGFLEQENIAGIITFQTNRSGAGGHADNESIGGAYEIAQCSDWMLTINQIEKSHLPKEKHTIPDEEIYEGGVEQVIENLEDDTNFSSYELNLSKAREGEKGKLKVNAMLNKMFYYDSQFVHDERMSVV